jgi:imidazolonepropionase-like amidohydrolase
MSGLLLTNARVVSRADVIDSGWLACTGTAIDSYGRGAPAAEVYEGRQVLDARGATVLPGLSTSMCTAPSATR